MKTNYKILLLLIFLSASSAILAQNKVEEMPTYQRSSLHNILIIGDAFENSDIVVNAYQSWPFPDKYNDHRIDLNSMNLADYALTEEEKEKFGLTKSEAASDATAGIISDNSQVKFELDKFIASKKLPFEM